MSDENSEIDDLDDISSSNIELESYEALSTVSSTPSQIFELDNNASYRPTGHIVPQLVQREIGLSNSKTIQIQPPLKSISLLRVFPPKVLQGQIFMGMTRCGKFLMTYSTHLLPMEEEWYGYVYRYRLHWWIIPGDGQACEVGSVALFGNAKVSTPLHIYICQWPKFNNKVLIYGLVKESVNVETGTVPSNQRAFVTVTAVPSGNKCVECNAAKDIFTLGDLQSNCENNLHVKCIVHSFTAHTSFDIAVPYPEFLPRIHLKFEDYAVFNTNNVLHALRISFDKGQGLPAFEAEVEEEFGLSVQVPPSPSSPCPPPSHLQEQIIRDFADDSSLTPRCVEDPCLSCLSPPMPTRLKTFLDPEPQPPQPSTDLPLPSHHFITPKVFLKVKRCGGKRVGFRPFFSRRKSALGMFLEPHTRKSSPYEFVDDSQSEVEQLSQFRRKRLAEKTYEFQECDSENIVPFSIARLGPGRYPLKLQVLRPLNRNTPPRTKAQKSYEILCEGKNSRPSSPAPHIRLTDNDILIHDISGRYGDLETGDMARLRVGLRRLSHFFRGTAANVTRRFHEVDEERASIVTDVEDEVVSTATGYHTLLNLEVHGAGYTQLHMSGSKLSGSCVRVEQQSLDIEAICQSVATSLCLVADKTFTFCSDYDIEVLDICPDSGEVLVLLMMRIEGCEGKKEEGSIVEQFETSVTLLWNLLQGDYRITMVVPPQKMEWAWNEKATWNPAREASRRFRANLPPDVTWAYPTVRVCSNTSYIRDVMSVCSDDTDVLVLCPPNIFTVPDDQDAIEADVFSNCILNNSTIDELLTIADERMNRYGSTDTLTPSSRTSYRSRSLHNTPSKYSSPKKNLLSSEPYIYQKERDEECLREIDKYFKGRENKEIAGPPVLSLDMPQVNDIIFNLEETERKLTENSKNSESLENDDESTLPIESVRRSLKFENALDLTKHPNNSIIQSKPLNTQLSIDTSEPPVHKESLLSLHNLWSSQLHAPKLTIYEEMKVLKQRLEEERLRRIHCEDLIRDLQQRLLESQEKMAVALKVDEEKDAAITKLKEGWSRAVQKWKELDEMKQELTVKLAEQSDKFNSERQSLTNTLKKYEQDLLKALNLVHDYNQEQKSGAKERDNMAIELTKAQENLDMSQQLNKALSDQLKEKDELLEKNSLKIDELTDLCKEFKKQLKQSHQERDRLVQENGEKLTLQKKLEEMTKKEIVLQEQLRSANKSKTDLKKYYQDQVESIVLEKQKDFQLQLANSEKNISKEFEAKERNLLAIAGQEKQQLIDKYKLEITVLEETHHEEIELYKMKLGHCSQKIEDLQVMLGNQNDRQHDLAEKLHSVIQTQWKETLKVISSSHKEGAASQGSSSSSKPALKRQNTFTKGDNALPVASSSSPGKITGSQTYRINETPQKMSSQNCVKDLLEQLMQQKDGAGDSNVRLDSNISNVNDTSSSSSKEKLKLKSEKMPWK